MATENIHVSRGTNRDLENVNAEIIVVGAGVVGLSIAKALTSAGREVIVLERHARPGLEVSSRNSEVIHAGLYYPPGSLRAQLCVAGARRLLDYCDARAIPVARTGKFIVATSPEEVGHLARIARTAAANGAPPLRHLSANEAQKIEPDLQCVAALHSPATAVLDSHALITALETDVLDAGGTLALRTEVTGISRTRSGAFCVETLSGATASRITATRLVIAAGLGATALGEMLPTAGAYRPPRTYPAKGHYFGLRGRVPFRHLIYPVPHGAWLGIHLTLDTAGAARFGPDLQWCDAINYAFDDPDGARRARFEREVRRFWPGLPDDALVPGSTGIRPKIYARGDPVRDFAIHDATVHGIPGLVALYGIESPGLTSCLAIGDHVARLLA